jgi:TRAP transporter TAXI family solute receptor
MPQTKFVHGGEGVLKVTFAAVALVREPLAFGAPVDGLIGLPTWDREWAVSVALAPTPVTLATGTPGGIYHPVGNAICRMYNLAGEHQALPCVAVSSDGSVANIRRVESGESTFGLSQTDVAYAAFHGDGPFAAAGPDPKRCSGESGGA